MQLEMKKPAFPLGSCADSSSNDSSISHTSAIIKEMEKSPLLCKLTLLIIFFGFLNIR